MGGSLQDQLLKAGLVTENKLKKAQADARKARKRAGKPKKTERARKQAVDPETQAALARKRERDRELNRSREEARDRKARFARVRDFVRTHRLNDPAGETKHYFNAGKKIKHIYVTSEQHAQLIAGALAIAVIEGRGELLDETLVERLLAIDPAVKIARTDLEDKSAGAEYAGFEVPDDLMW